MNSDDLPTFGRSGEHDERTFANEFANPRGRQQLLQRTRHARRSACCDSRRRNRPVVFLGKVDVVRDQRLEADDLVSQRENAPAQPAVELAQRRALRSARVRVDQIARRLGLQNVELSVEHRSPRELAGRAPGARPERSARRSPSSERPSPPCVMISTASSPVNDAGAS